MRGPITSASANVIPVNGVPCLDPGLRRDDAGRGDEDEIAMRLHANVDMDLDPGLRRDDDRRRDDNAIADATG